MAIYNNYKSEFSGFAEHLNHSSAESVVKSVRKKGGIDGLIKLAKTATRSKCAQDQAIRDLIKKCLKEAKEQKPDKTQKKKIKKIVKAYEELKKKEKQSHQNEKPVDQAAKEPAKKTAAEQQAQPTVPPSSEKVVIPASVVGLMGAFFQEEDRWEPGSGPKEKAKELQQLDQLLALFTEGTHEKEALAEMQKYKKCTEEVNQKIREAIHKPGVSFTFPEGLRDKLSNVTSLDLSSLKVPLTAQILREIVTHMPHLSELNLFDNTLSEETVKALSQFSNLRHLQCGATQMDDKLLSTLTHCCKKLRTLDLSQNKRITTLQPLASCVDLQDVDLAWCEGITSLQPLTSCMHLQRLGLSNCKIADLRPLASCLYLQDLDLCCCKKITDIQPLASCLHLQELDLTSCSGITNFQPLASCIHLQDLRLNNCKIANLQPLASCTRLKNLHLCLCVKIADIQPLASCRDLQELDLGDCNKISNIQPLASCAHLRSLILPAFGKVRAKQRTNLNKALPGLKIVLQSSDDEGWG